MISYNTIEHLEFNKLLFMIADIAKSQASKRATLQIKPLKSLEEIKLRQDLIKEIMQMYSEGTPLPIFDFKDLTLSFEKVRPEGSILEGKEIYDYLVLFNIIFDICENIARRKNSPHLKALISPLTGFPELVKIFHKSVDSDGNIKDSASSLLFELRTRVRGLNNKIKKKLEEILSRPEVSKFLQDEFITQRSGRWVIPVRMDSKGQVAGVVHDISSSGQTAFIEPVEIIAISNELESLLAEQKAEEIRILRTLTAKIRENLTKIEEEFKIVVYFDILNCIANFAQSLRMENPLIITENRIKLKDARHPLLHLTFKKQSLNKEVVPLNVYLGKGTTVMVITGANAGGKTITIKTIGLLVLMALSGMPIPADSLSEIPLLDNVLVDIGDDQSIESNLSTFTAHIKNMSEIIFKSAPRTLVLIDEIGKGTDPDEGAALACAILNELHLKGSIVFATTHLSAIKSFVYKHKHMINASMEFDELTRSPLYRLKIGEPGLSYAFEMAKKYGLPERIIEEAKQLMDRSKFEFEALVSELNRRVREYDNLISAINFKKSQIEEKEKLLEKKQKDLEDKKKEIFFNAYTEAQKVIVDTKRDINNILEQNKEKKKEALRLLREKQKEVEERIKEFTHNNADQDLDIDRIKEGDTIFIKSISKKAKVIGKNFKLKQLKVKIDSKELYVPIADTNLATPDLNIQDFQTYHGLEFETVPDSLNIVGRRVDEALSMLESFLNQATLAGISEVKIIHGVGKMILKRAVHEHLKNHPLVKGFSSQSHEKGGEGITIVRLI
ncbi:MAG: endonuclease MutS2 [Thermodesulfovibrionales bacterium]|nr:endonuclease MutS2 [Thermodesulfovibrionales bacterium]